MSYETIFSAFELQMKSIDFFKIHQCHRWDACPSSMLTSVAYWATHLLSTYIDVPYWWWRENIWSFASLNWISDWTSYLVEFATYIFPLWIMFKPFLIYCQYTWKFPSVSHEDIRVGYRMLWTYMFVYVIIN